MRIVTDFDGVFTDPTSEGEWCFDAFRDSIVQLRLKNLETLGQVNSWLSEVKVRQAGQPYQFGWRSEGRISAFTFEDPFVRNIGLADFLDALVASGDEKAKLILGHLVKKSKLNSFAALSEKVFHELKLKKTPDKEALAWVKEALKNGHEVIIVSNSATEKIEDFLTQNEFDLQNRPQVRGGAKKFSLGSQSHYKVALGQASGFGLIEVDANRPNYEQILLELKPDVVMGDVFSLDLALPVRLKREGKLSLNGGLYYRVRDYTPYSMLSFFSAQKVYVPEVTCLRDWSRLKLA